MTERPPIYNATEVPPVDAPLGEGARLPAAVPVDDLPGLWRAYLNRRREALIMELRALDRALGRAQTIPERTR